jgi:hypothetical protein
MGWLPVAMLVAHRSAITISASVIPGSIGGGDTGHRRGHPAMTSATPTTPLSKRSEPQKLLLRYPDRAPNGADVKALRPLRGRATPEP